MTAAFFNDIPRPITNNGINNTPPDIPIEPEASPIIPPNRGRDQSGRLILILSFKLISNMTIAVKTENAMWKYIFNSFASNKGPKYNSDITVIGTTPIAINIVFFQSGRLFCLIYLYKANEARTNIETYAINFASNDLSFPMRSIINGMDTTPPPRPISEANIDENNPIRITKGIIISIESPFIQLL